MHFAGALKSAPPLARLPFDLTAAAAALLLPSLALLLATRRWRVSPLLGPPLLAAGGLWLWLVLAGTWSPSVAVLPDKLPEIVLLGPAMLLAGLAIGADAAAHRRFCAATLLIGGFVAAAVALGLAAGTVVLGGDAATANPDLARVQYQLAGLAMACAAGLAALRATAARGLARLPWLALVAALAAGVLLPGGRTALAGLGLAVALAPSLRFLLQGRAGAALAWAGAVALAGALGLAALLADPGRAAGLRTLERLTVGQMAESSGRAALWGEALRRAGETAPLGLGTGAFTIAAGHGERRGLYPHNHALEALAEAGLPGLLLWLGAFGGALAAALRLLPRVPPERAARIAALVLPVALSLLVSTDLGNRMAWFALGLTLSLGLEVRPAATPGPRRRAGPAASPHPPTPAFAPLAVPLSAPLSAPLAAPLAVPPAAPPPGAPPVPA
ncbi:O-antigen ligase domain-containing protein [Roseomonas sp. NAR14]|uniref:O-antigen ligase domain-containing protein n=2 Tax=Roseomonas acroporae TaxID=2937791 RepID=A0A9X1YDU3_9PROT|nr:O-antigen ligase domain-containing protein [Roseomonas acroporae]